MRRLGLTGAILAVLAGAWLLGRGRDLADGLAGRKPAPAWRLRKVPEALVSIAYVLEAERWLTFELPPEQRVLRLLVNAELPGEQRSALPTPLPEEVQWAYALRYQLLDAGGRVLTERDYHQRTRLSEYHDESVGATITSAFYLGDDRIPADGRTLMVNLEDAPAATRLRLRLLHTERPLTGAVVRIYHKGNVPAYKLRYLWQRLTPGRREQLARGNIYPEDLLTEAEKHTRLSQRLAPVAPMGIAGRDYQQRELYVLREIEGEPVRDRPPPAGLLVDRQRRAVIPIPEDGGQVRLDFQALPLRSASAHATGSRQWSLPQPTGKITLSWKGKKLTQRATHTVSWNGRHATFEAALGGGLVEVEAEDALAVRAYLVIDPRIAGHGVSKTMGRRHRADDREITPELIYTWSYLLQGDGPVEFPISHGEPVASALGARPTGSPVRVDLRLFAPLPTGELPGEATIALQMLDAQGRLVRQEKLPVVPERSLYDRLLRDHQDLPVSEPATSYFRVPPEVALLRFPPVPAPVVLGVANRPARLVKETRVPEDYYRFNRDEVAQRSWFVLRASGHDRLVRQNRALVLALQSRLAEDDPDLLAGRFEWEDHLPHGDWLGRPLLVPRDPEAPFRPEALAVTFEELPLGKEVGVRFQAEPGRHEVAPSLLLLRREKEPLSLQVYLNGRLHHEETVVGPRAEVLLPPLRLAERGSRHDPRCAGRYLVRVHTSRPVRLFLNQHDPGKAPALVKRLAVRLDAAGLVFDYDKTATSEELLSLFLFRAHGTALRTVVSVRLLAPPSSVGPHPTWTIRDRRYDVRPAQGDPVAVLGTSAEVTDPGQVCFFPVGDDVAPGRYRLRVSLDKGPGGYIILARTTPGPYEKRTFFHEHAAWPRRGE